MIEIVAHDELVTTIIEAIQAVAKTGKIGDGKIFVSDVLEVVRSEPGSTATTLSKGKGGALVRMRPVLRRTVSNSRIGRTP